MIALRHQPRPRAGALGLDRAGIAAERGLAVERVEAVDGRDPAALAGEPRRRRAAGSRPAEIACFESHRARLAADRRRATRRSGWCSRTTSSSGGHAPACSPASRPRPTGSTSSSSTPTRAGCSSAPCRSPGSPAGALLRPAQGTSDSSAYVISRGFAARALAIHGGYRRPLDVALFDPATCPAIAQVDPAVTIQQRYADFRFLDEGGAEDRHPAATGPRRRSREPDR